MTALGISIYPSKSTYEEMAAYLDLASQIGYSRIFTSMLEVADDPQETVTAFKKIIAHGNSLGMKISIDVNPNLFTGLGISSDDLAFFADLGVWSVRLDEGFTGFEEAQMTHNPYGVKIELNISRGQHYLDLIMDFGANRNNLIGSHNFYPQAYTGLDFDYFQQTAQQYKDHYLLTAAFVDTASGKLGPWPVSDLMVSTEEQRSLPLVKQIRLLKATGLIDDIFISSSLVSEADLKLAWQAFQEGVAILEVDLSANISPLEKTIVCQEKHLYRGDYSAYMIRSSQPRVKYRSQSIAPLNQGAIKRGQVTIGNDLAGQYKGELQLALKGRPNNGSQNIVAQICPDDLLLLSLLQPWHSFFLRETGNK